MDVTLACLSWPIQLRGRMSLIPSIWLWCWNVLHLAREVFKLPAPRLHLLLQVMAQHIAERLPPYPYYVLPRRRHQLTRIKYRHTLMNEVCLWIDGWIRYAKCSGGRVLRSTFCRCRNRFCATRFFSLCVTTSSASAAASGAEDH